MFNTERVQETDQMTGPVNDLKALDRLAIDDHDQKMSRETLVAPSDDTHSVARAISEAASLEMENVVECRSVPLKDLRQYLFLAEELALKREETREKELSLIHI